MNIFCAWHRIPYIPDLKIILNFIFKMFGKRENTDFIIRL